MSCATGALIALWLAAPPDAPREWLPAPEDAARPLPPVARRWQDLPPARTEPKLVVDGGWPGKVMPVAVVRLWTFGVPYDVVGLSVALTETHPLETETGLAMTWHGASMFARGGLSLGLLERRSRSGGGVSMRLPLLAGMRAIAERAPDRWLIGYTATTGLNVILWLAEDAGVDLEVLAGANVWAYRLGDPTPVVSPDLRVSAGLTF